MECAVYFTACCFLLLTFVNGFPSQCKDDKFYDHRKQEYLPCSKCEDKQMGCRICCSTSKPEVEPIDTSVSSNTEPTVSSLKDNSDKAKYQILNIFLQSFLITMVISTLLVLVYVAIKSHRERQEAECQHGNHFHNAYANMVQEVLTIDPPSSAAQSDLHQSTCNCEKSSGHVNKAVNIGPDVGPNSSVSLNQKV